MTRPLAHPHIAIRASAGTGKTFALTNRYLQLLALGESPGRILATTFSRKAAGEMTERIIQRLADAARSDAHAAELSEQIGGPALDAARCGGLLAEVLRQAHRLNIGTLDSIFHRIAGAFAMELDLPEGWRIAEGRLDQVLRRDAISAMLDRDDPQPLIDWLRLMSGGKPSRSVMDPLDGAVGDFHALYAAVPDPGPWTWFPELPRLKTEDTANAIERLEEFQAQSKRIANARRDDIKRFREQDWRAFCAKGIAKAILGNGLFYNQPLPDGLADLYKPLIHHARAMLVKDLADQTGAAYALMRLYDGEYRRLQGLRRQLRFEDVTGLLARAQLTGRLDDMYYRLDGRIAHLMIDEFQDTSIEQWRIVQPIAEEVSAHATGDRTFFCVGDVKQAIYGWRKGEARLFGVLDEACHHGLHWDELNKSYRSSPVIIQAVNEVFSDLASNPAVETVQEPVAGWAADFTEHDTAKRDLPGYVELRTVPAEENVDDQRRRAWPIAADQIAALHEAIGGRSIGVLVRRNATVRRLIYELRKRGVMASEEGGNPLTDSPAVSAVLSLLHLADHPGDTAARFHVEKSPLGPIVGLTDWRNDTTARQLAYKVRRELVDCGYGPTLYHWTRGLAGACDDRNFRRLIQLVERGHEHDEHPTLRPTDFIEAIHTERVEDPTTAPVRVMTIHQSKGLQFDAVVLPELNVSLKPRSPRVLEYRESVLGPIERISKYPCSDMRNMLSEFAPMLAEHQRSAVHDSLSMLYVALTRARCAMYLLTWAEGKAKHRVPASFADVLEYALTGQIGHKHTDEPLFEDGDADWHTRLTDRMEQSEAPPAVDPERAAVDSAQRSRLLVRQSPSQLAGAQRIDLSCELRLETDPAALRGTVMHQWFEQVDWLDAGDPPDRDALRAGAAAQGAPEDQLDDWLDDFFAALEQPEIREALLQSSFDEGAALHRERRFAMRAGDTLLSGAIDRLVVMTDRAVVIDYKTDQVSDDPALLQEKADHYRPQIEAYRKAAARITGLPLDRIEARLLFTTPGRAVAL